MHDKVYNHFSTESNIGSRKICMDELVFLTFFVPPATPLPKFDARSLYFERASYFAHFVKL